MATEQATAPAGETIDIVGAHIAKTPGYCGGKPRIAGTRIWVWYPHFWHELRGMPIDEIVEQYHLTKAQVYAALAYYHEHAEEVDRLEAEDTAWVEQFMKDHPERVVVRPPVE